MKIIIKLIAILFFSQTIQSCSLLSAAGLSSQGQPVKEVTEDLSSSVTALVDHSQWDALLKKHVDKNGLVDYKGFLKDRSQLDSYLKMLSENVPTEAWSVQELLAYYINTYNAYTVDLILDNYPVKSIKDISGAWTKAIVPIGDKTLSLGGIENGILRKMNEPRIHFAINCASFSCPDLLNEAFTADKIDAQLDKVTRSFINGPKNDIGITHLKLSKIFDWYKKDYVINGKNDVIAYVNAYLFKKIKINPNATITYFEYDWDLNEQY
ncbi:MAG TPA: DUF547 domain-containing protein [Flavobacteriaceae bacterium]|nr:hypothetical protein [Flavobacteriaceae bacterium]HAT64388.1 DUF547 domain-containing protein [Flavobacteriaceae bacterium]|tara:strand:- start:1139 stop:1939 length:801 start_codon:yes stop_codon:yes gene_type:complete